MVPGSVCPYCDVALEADSRPYMLRDVYLGRFEFLVCPVCERQYSPEETSRAIEEAAKENGLWGVEAAAIEEQAPVATIDDGQLVAQSRGHAIDSTAAGNTDTSDETPEPRAVHSSDDENMIVAEKGKKVKAA